jgi:hypothetical protein
MITSEGQVLREKVFWTCEKSNVLLIDISTDQCWDDIVYSLSSEYHSIFISELVTELLTKKREHSFHLWDEKLMEVFHSVEELSCFES